MQPVTKEQFTVGKCEGDRRFFWINRQLAQRWADRGQQLWSQVGTTAVQFEPNHGFVAVLFTDNSIPSAWEEGYEVRPYSDSKHVEEPRVPEDWAKARAQPTTAKQPTATAATGAAPVKGATAKVWEVANKFHAEKPLTRADRATVVNACIEMGINKSTAGVQWSKWAKHNGL